jgi:hypothetical protein
LLVPEAAIASEQVRKLVYVVGADNVVAQKYVTLGEPIEKLRIVKQGLNPTDRVVVSGLMRAHAGQKVTPQEEGVAPVSAAPTDAKAAQN